MLKKIAILAILLLSSSLFAMTLSELNLAPESKLMEIKGIGAKKASRIIQARKKGKFKSMNDVLKIKGIGKKILMNIKSDTKSTKRKTKSRSKKRTPMKKKPVNTNKL